MQTPHTLSLPQHTLKILQRLQNRALQIIYNSHSPLQELHTRAKLQPVRQRADRQLMFLMYRKSLLPETYPQLTNPAIETRTFDKIRFDILRPGLEKFKNFPCYRGMCLVSEYIYSARSQTKCSKTISQNYPILFVLVKAFAHLGSFIRSSRVQ